MSNDSRSWLGSTTEKPETLVGKDLKGYCGACKDNRMHTIISISANGDPDKAQCNSCGTTRKYKPPKSEKGEEGDKKRPKKAKATSKSAKALKVEASSLPLSMLPATSEDLASFEARMSALATTRINPKNYAMDERFNTNEVINHPTFGTGFVVHEVGKSKIEVLFSVGRKLLMTALKE